MKLTVIEARDLPEAWFQCIKQVLSDGYEYVIDRGSFAEQKRKEFDLVIIKVLYPGTRPLVPNTPVGVPPPTTMDYVENDYYPNYLCGITPTDEKVEKHELYTYGDDIAPQISPILDMYIRDGFETNQACMSIGCKRSIYLEHSQCLRVIDTRIRNGFLEFVVYFRSWDLWGGFPVNLAAIQLLKEGMAKTIGVEDGNLIAISKGLHLYDHCWELAKTVVHAEEVSR